MSRNSLRSPYFQKFAVFPKNLLRIVTVPFISIGLAALVGAVILILSGVNPLHAYSALLRGAFGSVSSITRTLDKTTPLLFTGLSIAFAFKSGLFNIGAQGQLILGALAAGVAGYYFQYLPFYIHVPLALLAGALAGSLFGALKGLLKAYTGAHEVITGIMLNYVAINLTDYLSSGPFMDTSSGNIIARTPAILQSAQLPHIHSIPLGFLIAVFFALVIWWIIKYTTFGFAVQTVGKNIHAARYAGIRVHRILIITMLISGILAGIGGAIETLGILHRFQPGFNVGLGFEGITIALLGKTHPFGVVLASVLFGAMKAGANQMQFNAGVSIELIDVLIAMILFFVAADIMIKKLMKSKEDDDVKITLTTGWGKY
jgi:simple sugar transport system permease protein